jgi:hypothetical protein
MLVLHARRDPHARFSHYLAEILRLEGFTALRQVDIDDLDERTLADADFLVIPRLTLTHRERDLLLDRVAAGARMIAFQPETSLAERCGLTPTYRCVAECQGYLRIDTDAPHAAGLCDEPVQIVVPAPVWDVAADTEVETLAELRDATDPTRTAPGVLRLVHGRGEVVFIAYDLPHAVARLRQGDPAYADVWSSGVDRYYRPHELFVHQLPPRQQRLPQADVQTALLARLVETLTPQPRLWYYPEATTRSVLVMTSDDDWSTVEQFEALLDGLRRHDATCTFFIVPGTKVTRERMDDWERAGHSFSVHPALPADHRAGPPPAVPQARFVPEMIRDNVARHRREYDRPVRTLRNHIIRWAGYLEPARVFAELGVRMEFNYFSVVPLPVGHLNGSGRPLRFVDQDGALLDCYQQGTAWSEEVLLHPEFTASVHWHSDRAIRETERLIRDAARVFHTPLTVNSHPVSFATYSRPLIEANWATARAEGLPIVSADRWLDWTETRERLTLEPAAGGWRLHAPVSVGAVTVLLPPGLPPAQAPADTSRQTIHGRDYQAFTFRDLAAGDVRTIALGPVEGASA